MVGWFLSNGSVMMWRVGSGYCGVVDMAAKEGFVRLGSYGSSWEFLLGDWSNAFSYSDTISKVDVTGGGLVVARS